ncbi:pseudouridine synthase [Haloferula rosea]|uniref:Pseudouridine synthase n=1 Tax=Haloferula rosea TaxID=490093 RepID=A0A934VFC5_9BACT|nr:pseudouridine synthase [Haloferula rosea]MBK1826415.1 pseudouridine synthase [Haloferula rosea]
MLIVFHKPYGVLCQFTQDQPGQRTLADFGFPKNVWPIGRLDMDSEGLLLFSDEKALVDRLLNPRAKQPKTYLAQVEGIPDSKALTKLSDGTLHIKGHRCRPARAHLPDPQPAIPPRDPPIRVRASIPDRWITLTLTEGKNRQVRRMTAAVGHPTLRLIRIAIGDLELGELESGVWQEADATQRQQLGLRV